jgi:hypothetical protein
LPAALGEANGGWVSYGDGTSNATLTLSSDSVPGGMNSILCEVSGFAEWGGCLLILGSGIDLTASGRKALQFWARAPTPYEVRVNFSDRTSDYSGGICDGEQNCFENCCHDHYGTQFTATGDWTQYTFRFDELTREEGNGPPLPFDPTHVREVGFRLVEPADFELEIFRRRDDRTPAALVCQGQPAHRRTPGAWFGPRKNGHDAGRGRVCTRQGYSGERR